MEKDGLVMTIDGECPWGLYEFKTANTDSSKFSPNSKRGGVYAHWAQRILGYMYATGAEEITLAIYFLSGNTPSHRGGMAGRESVVIRTFSGKPSTDTEAAENWGRILARKQALEDAISNGTPLPDEYTGEPWECSGCNYSEVCTRWRAF
ncbi:MAG: hypothetical protein MZV70_03365 [Desulfobacterales bacterium]|nr:hypothetical protein [Desulfobacterales bacterium]